MAACPRCRQPLVQNQVDEFTVRLCVPCKGMLLPHADLVKILERSWHIVTPEAAERLEFHATDPLKTESAFLCPDCGRPMEKYGYMGLAAIPIDYCDLCALLWLDADELQSMVLALAKDNYRSERALHNEWARRIELAHATVPPAGAAVVACGCFLITTRRL
jgi:Zn-finger nucleic acid-binding protein